MLPFWDDRLLLGLGEMAGKGSVVLLAAMVAHLKIIIRRHGG